MKVSHVFIVQINFKMRVGNFVNFHGGHSHGNVIYKLCDAIFYLIEAIVDIFYIEKT